MDKSCALDAVPFLSQPARLDVFRPLVKADETGTALKVRRNTISTDLSVLLQSGLVRNEHQGRTIRCIADMAGVRGHLVFPKVDCCRGCGDTCHLAIDQIACTDGWLLRPQGTPDTALSETP